MVTLMHIFLRLGAAVAAMLLLTAPALADGNFASFVQSGDDNAATITQGPGSGNAVGTAGLAATQAGSRNILTIVQSGNGNRIGTAGTGFRQDSNRSSATITQNSDNNVVGEVTQTGIGAGVGGDALRRNVLDIVQQGGAGNRVDSVTQTRTFAAPDAAANSANIVQTGAGNRVGTLLQTGYANQAVLTQTGNGNRVGTLKQRGAINIATLTLTGDDNAVDVDQFSPRDGNTAIVALTGDRNRIDIAQAGNANKSFMSVLGSDNLFGSRQLGFANTIALGVAGDHNRADFAQSGAFNTAAVKQLIGSHNQLDFRQDGFANTIDVVAIDGDRNHVDLVQTLRLNTAKIGIAGDRNRLEVRQRGVANTLDLSIVGSGNNNPGNGGFVDLPFATPLTPGSIVQSGSLNAISYGLGAPGQPANDNKFAFSQTGTGNIILGNTWGSNNQVVIVQNGSANLAVFTQNGFGNTIGVSQ